VRGLQYHLDLIYELTKKELKVRYKNSALGYLWSVLNPLAMAGVFYVGLGLIIGVRVPRGEDYPFWLLLICGLFPWQWFSNSVNACTNVYIGNANLIRKVAFRREVLPLATVLNDLVHFAVSIPVIVLFLLLARHRPTLAWLYGVPLLVLAQFVMTYSLSLVTGALNLFFRDLANLVQIFLQMLFYMTPVIYSLKWSRIAAFRHWLLVNPLASLISGWQTLFLEGRFSLGMWQLAMGYSVVMLAAGMLVHRKLEGKFAEVT